MGSTAEIKSRIQLIMVLRQSTAVWTPYTVSDTRVILPINIPTEAVGVHTRTLHASNVIVGVTDEMILAVVRSMVERARSSVALEKAGQVAVRSVGAVHVSFLVSVSDGHLHAFVLALVLSRSVVYKTKHIKQRVRSCICIAQRIKEKAQAQ